MSIPVCYRNVFRADVSCVLHDQEIENTCTQGTV